MAVDLLHRIENDAHHNQQGGAAEELGELLVHVEECAHDSGQDGHESQEEGAREGDFRHDVIDELGGLLTGFHAWDEAAVLLQLFRNLLRVDGDGRVEIGEEDDHDEEHDIVAPAGIVDETVPEAAGGDFRHIDESQRQEHECLCEDDRHNASCVHLEGEEVASAAILLVADHSLGILHGDAARTLNEKDTQTDDEQQDKDFDDENDRAAGIVTHAGDELEFEGCRETGDDTDHNDEGDTVADALVGDFLTQPHQEQSGADEQVERGDGKGGDAEDFGGHHRMGDGAVS